ncbi:hypothetical protein GCM10027068_11670 [Prescottella soli]
MWRDAPEGVRWQTIWTVGIDAVPRDEWSFETKGSILAEVRRFVSLLGCAPQEASQKGGS